MADRMEEISLRYEEIINELKDPALGSDSARMTALLRELSRLKPVVETNEALKALKKHISEDEALLSEEDDEEMKALLKEEISSLQKASLEKEQELKNLLIPKDPKDERSVILEIRSGTGGDEAQLFAADLYRMYARYAERRGWKMETTEFNDSPIGGVSKVTAIVNGKGAWSALKHESGIHRVQRVPKTESQGRIQTSACSVAVLPEAEDVDVEIRPEDIRF
ncbi:MAG: PCRF domain-containing protein, partial [Lachnospiraceae bacterium]|nr:PCRF domain-containing protein [Lachnospiraceae bacterium]